jgi:membrane protein YqaA with SNARE-associated domain
VLFLHTPPPVTENLASNRPKSSPIRRLYDWTIALAGKPHAETALFLVAFAESSFFPLPPDLILVPMTLAKRERAWRYAAVCTVASVLGGLVGYAIGYYLLATVGRPILRFYGVIDQYHHLKEMFDQWGVWIILIKGMTPIPYKLVTITAGALNFALVPFVLASLVSRAVRFFLVAGLLWKFGEPVRHFIEKRLELVTMAFLVLLVAGFFIIRYFV